MFALIPKHLRNPYRLGKADAKPHRFEPAGRGARKARARDLADQRRWLRDTGIL